MDQHEFLDKCNSLIASDDGIYYDSEAMLIEYMAKRHPDAWEMARQELVAEDDSLEEFGSFTPSISEVIDHGFDAIDQELFLKDLQEVIDGLLDGRQLADGDWV